MLLKYRIYLTNPSEELGNRCLYLLVLYASTEFLFQFYLPIRL